MTKTKTKTKTKQGFTIIEVILVLAVAGLIFLMIFVALPALQRSQRDAERKRSLMLIVTAMESWNSRNRKPVSNTWSARNNKTNGFCTFYNNYIDPEIKDPSTGEAFKGALWGSTNVIDCQTGEVTDRGEFDMDEWVHPKTANDSWPKMELGDLQYDEGAYCEDENFNDNVGKYYGGVKIFAFRIKLENGGYYCVDNGSGVYGKK